MPYVNNDNEYAILSILGIRDEQQTAQQLAVQLEQLPEIIVGNVKNNLEKLAKKYGLEQPNSLETNLVNLIELLKILDPKFKLSDLVFTDEERKNFQTALAQSTNFEHMMKSNLLKARSSKEWIIFSPGTGDDRAYGRNVTRALGSEKKMLVLDPASGLTGTVAGVGEDANIEFVLEQLREAKKNGTLPRRIYFEGHSRGAVQNIELANRIYEEFGEKIKISMTLTDPVAGPNRGYVDNKICIPPNVDSVVIVYYSGEGTPGFKAQDIGTRIVAFDTNKTTITSFSIPRTHFPIAISDPHRDLCNYILSVIKENADLVSSGKKPDYHINPEYQIDPATMRGIGSRSGCNFAVITPINADLPEHIKMQHMLAREVFPKNEKGEILLKPIEKKVPDHIKEILKDKDTPEQRKAYKEAMIDHFKGVNRHELTKGEVLAVALHALTFGLSTLVYNLNDTHRTHSKGFTIAFSVLTLGILPLVERISRIIQKTELKSKIGDEPIPAPPAPREPMTSVAGFGVDKQAQSNKDNEKGSEIESEKTSSMKNSIS